MFYEVEIPEPRGASGEPTGYIICELGRQLRLGCFGSAQPTQGALSKGESKRKQRPYSMAKPSGKWPGRPEGSGSIAEAHIVLFGVTLE